MAHELTIPGGDGAVLNLRSVAARPGRPAHTVLELAVGDLVGRATFGSELAETVVGHARDSAALANAEAALLAVASTPAPLDWMRRELADLGPFSDYVLADLCARFLEWRAQAASQVYRAVSMGQKDGLHAASRPGTRLPGQHVAVCGDAGSAEVAQQLCPDRAVVRYGDQLGAAVWQSALLLEGPQSLGDDVWLNLQVAPRLAGCGCGVRLDGPTPPGRGQNKAHIVIAWHPEDLDAIAAELGCSPWLTLWGTTHLPSMLTQVIVYGEPRDQQQAAWFDLVRARAVSTLLMLPRPRPTARGD